MASQRVNTDGVKNALQGRASEPHVSAQDPSKKLNALLKSMAGEIQRALPKHMNADRLARIALTEVRRAPKLLECDQLTFIAALMQCAQLGLEPGPLGHAYLIPYWETKTKSYVVQFQIGYQGMIDLMRRSGEIAVVVANDVHENDEFEYSFGTGGGLRHKPLLRGSRGPVTSYYAYVRTKDGGESYFVSSVEDMETFRDKYGSKNRDGRVVGPWINEFDAMARKTCIKQAAKYMPKSIELATQMASDETVKAQIAPDMSDVIDMSMPIGQTIDMEPSQSTESEQLQEEYNLDEIDKQIE